MKTKYEHFEAEHLQKFRTLLMSLIKMLLVIREFTKILMKILMPVSWVWVYVCRTYVVRPISKLIQLIHQGDDYDFSS